MHCVSRRGSYLVNSCCELQEDNQWRKESYEACWLSLVLETRPQYRLTLSETDSVRRESYKQQQVVHFMVQRSPSQTLSLGSDSSTMTTHRLPLFSTSSDLCLAEVAFQCRELQAIMREEGDAVVEKQEVSAATQDFSKPVGMNFRASSLMSSPRETSQRVQRRE